MPTHCRLGLQHMNCGSGAPAFSPKNKLLWDPRKKRNTFRQVLIYQLNVLEIEGGLWAHQKWPDNPHRKNKMNTWNRHDTMWTVQRIRIIWYVMSYFCMGKSTGRFLERYPSLWWNFHNPYILVYFQISLVLYLWNLSFSLKDFW